VERRVFVAILLSALVMYAYQALFVPEPSPSKPPPTSPPPASSRPENVVEAAPSPPPVDAPVVVGDAAEREIVVETGTLDVVFSNRGGVVRHWRLKQYRDEAGRPIDLVPSEVPDAEPRPFSLLVEDAGLTRRLQTAVYRAAGDSGGRVDATRGPAALTFDFSDATGLTVRKEFRFDSRGYIVAFSASVSDGTRMLNPGISWGPGLDDSGASAGGGSFFTGNYVQPPGALFHRDGEVERPTTGDLASQPAYEGAFRYAGVDDHYFMVVAFTPGRARLEFRPVSLTGNGGVVRHLVSHTLRFEQPPRDLRFFAGPKQFDLLESVDRELTRAINYGMFAWLVVPLLKALQWLYGFLGNYGWAIVVLTVLINLALAPLRHKTVVSTRKMQEIQPQIRAIQDRYAHLKATDPERQKMNAEVMKLYREKGANPASGCVPMLLTLPVLIAFYSLLSMSIELRGAPFGWWIQDLSVADPYYVLPALMGATMFWQQWITPAGGDPVQQRVLLLMPVMFTLMMAFSPSGAVLYWFVGQLWAIGQQYFTNWLIGPPVAAAARPPAERRLKGAGDRRAQGRTRQS
jgi:YidC/Oxa1 family membrane protein insertase